MAWLPGIPSQAYSGDFLEWWSAYPRRVAKREAAIAWNQTRHLRPPLRVLVRITKVHAATWKHNETPPTKIPYPATWLRGARWEDELQRSVSDGLLPSGKVAYKVETWTPDYIYEEEEHGADA